MLHFVLPLLLLLLPDLTLSEFDLVVIEHLPGWTGVRVKSFEAGPGKAQIAFRARSRYKNATTPSQEAEDVEEPEKLVLRLYPEGMVGIAFSGC